jgi:aspartyl-tRNA(Asn)/glutamyl-tRNA(Gln) amidotransferase subunit C
MAHFSITNRYLLMSIDSSQIEKIAWLARLSLSEDDIPAAIADMGKILGLVEQMNSVDTSDIEALAHPMDIKARLRPDEITEEDQREIFQQLAPAVQAGHYLVPKVIE